MIAMSEVEQLEKELAVVRDKKKASKTTLEKLAEKREQARQKREKLKARYDELKAEEQKLKRLETKIMKANKRKAENHRKYTYGGLIVKYAEWIDEEALEELLIKHHEEFQQAKKSLPFVMTIGKDKTE